MATPFAAVVLAHNDPLHVRRLIAALGDCPVVLHWDAKSGSDGLSEVLRGNESRILLAPRRDTRLASWSLVDAELRALAFERERIGADHVAVMSGADYPLVGYEQLLQRLARLDGRTWMFNVPLPFARWDVPGFRDGGLWRFRHHFPVRRDQIVWIGSKPLFAPWRRRIHPDLEPRASEHWKVYGRGDVDRLIDRLRHRPDLTRYGRTMFIPEESFLASVLASRRLFGEDHVPVGEHSAWYLLWPDADPRHPHWMTLDELPVVRSVARFGLDGLPGVGVPAGALDRPDPGEPITAEAVLQRPLFARKFSSSASYEILEAVDRELRRSRGPEAASGASAAEGS